MHCALAVLGSLCLLPCVSPGAPISIDNTATATHASVGNTGTVTLQSGTVTATVTPPPPSLQFFSDAEYSHQDKVSRIGLPLYLEVIAYGCQRDSASAESITVVMEADRSGDLEHITLLETAPNTSIYRSVEPIVTHLRSHEDVAHQSHALELQGEDALTASVETCGGTDSGVLLIDPIGVAFDSVTNLPIAGVQVRLVDVTGEGNGGHPGEDAIVYGDDEITRAPATIVTGEDGVYHFALVAPSVYRLDVVPAATYTYPSVHPPESLPADREIQAGASYGGTFPVNESTGLVTLDTPLDAPVLPAPLQRGSVFLEKRASQPFAEIADSVEYTIELRNASNVGLSRLVVEDTLPPGFIYMRGSTRLDAQRAPDPQRGDGRKLLFEIADTTDDGVRTLTYRALIGPAASEGDAVNSATVVDSAPIPVASNTATATIAVKAGVFDSRGYILGTIYTDCSGDGLRQADEPGIPDVRLYLEDGSFVNSDAEGKYSFYGVTPRTHVLKIDGTTLPRGALPSALSHRQGGHAATRFVDIRRGELYRADFAIADCSDAMRAEIGRRHGNAAELGRELDAGVKAELRPDDTLPSADVRALPASGIVGEAVAALRLSRAEIATAAGHDDQSLHALLPALDAKLGFIQLHDGDQVGTRQLTVRAKGPAGGKLQLIVNDVLVGDDRVGTRITDEARNLQVVEYVGVGLTAGSNNLTLVHRDTFGNNRGLTTIGISAAGSLHNIVVQAPADGTPADGEHRAAVHVELKDENGLRVDARTPVTLESTLGDWQTADLDDLEPGVQTFISGSATFDLRSSRTTGTAQVRASSGALEGSAPVQFVAALRPLVGSGIVEGLINIKDLSSNALRPASRDDGFEEELRAWSSGDDDRNYGARAALFLKGSVRGDYLLTLGFDSDKDGEQPLFRDIQPDQFYPVYGDSSVRGYDAQSTGKLYIRIDRNRSYLLAGDIAPAALTPARSLGAYNRSLRGVKEHFESGAITVDAFASHDNTRQIVEEIATNGTSGPFFLANAGLVGNSEQVEIVTRDRNQPSLILHAVLRQRFSDYEIESLTGRLLFRAPIPSVDADLNPVSIRITYETEQGGPDFLTAGAETRLQVSPQWDVGAAYVDNRDPGDPLRLGSANTTLRLGEKTKVVAEVARLERADDAAGHGQRAEIVHDGRDLQLRLFAARTDAQFDNPAAILNGARSEAGLKVGYSISERSRVIGEAVHSASVTTRSEIDGALLGIERSLAQNVKGELGMRHVRSADASGTPNYTTTARTRLSVPVPGLATASLFGEYEQDLAQSDNRVAAVGGDYRLANRSKLYLRHEIISSLTGPYELDPTKARNSTVFGIDTSYLDNSRLFSEYRVANALSGRETQAAIGLRNGWNVAPGLRLNTSFEHVDVLRGTQQPDSAALTGAIEYTANPLWKGTARLELRDSDTSDGLLSTLGLAYKLSDNWAVLAKNVLAIADNDGAQSTRRQMRSQLGLAYRDGTNNRVNGLGRYEFKQERGVLADLARSVHIFSAHANYQGTATTVWRAQYAAKYVEEDFYSERSTNVAHLLAARVTRDFGRRWDGGLTARALSNGHLDAYQFGLGAEGGYLVADNLWLSIGYNILGFREQDLAESEYTDRGAYLRLRFKFDESLLDAL